MYAKQITILTKYVKINYLLITEMLTLLDW